MPDIKSLDNYQGVVFGFEDLLADRTEAEQMALTDAFKRFANVQDVFDSRFVHIDDGVHKAAQALGLGDAETIAWTLAQAYIIEDEGDVEDDYVTGILELKQQTYGDVLGRGLPEIVAAGTVAHAVGDRLKGKTGIVTVSPLRAVKAFLKHNHLEEAIPYSRIVATDDESESTVPSPEQYNEARQRLGVSDPEGLLVIDCSPKALIAAKKAGASVVAILNGQPRATWEALEDDPFAPDFMDNDFFRLRHQLGIQAHRVRMLR
jgi:beta-phosphoglucomutase-like phosphatase (HAD superfamily)